MINAQSPLDEASFLSSRNGDKGQTGLNGPATFLIASQSSCRESNFQPLTTQAMLDSDRRY
jgi:hypothetical protein